MSEMRNTYSIIDSSGELVTYDDPYASVTEDKIEMANALEQYIVEQDKGIQYTFLKLGAALNKFEDEELYLARGFPTFRSWLMSAQFSFSYEHATRLQRIVREIVPILGTENLPPISTLKEILPMLSEGASEDDIREAVEEVKDLTTKDARARLRELRGIEEKERPAIFTAKVQRGESYHRVSITRTGDDGIIYNVTPSGPLTIRPEDWGRWAERFSEEFITYED